MNKKTLLLLINFCFITNIFSQTTDVSKKVIPLLGKNEIYISYGILSASGLGIGLGRTSFNQDFPSSYFYNKDKYAVKTKEIPPLIGALNFGYKRYFVKNKIAVSANITYSQINTNYTHTNTDSLSFKTKDYLIAFMPAFEYHYLNKKIVQLYSGVQLGLFVYNQKYQDYKSEIKHKEINFAFQVDAFGVRVGKQIGGFIELGFGFGGIVKVGISGRF
jgi:hypothetical protein